MTTRTKKIRYSSSIPFDQLPKPVQRAMQTARRAWDRHYAAERRFDEVMERYFETDSIDQRLWGDIGA